MASKKKRAKKYDVRKKRAKLLKEKEKRQPKEEREENEEKKKFRTEKEEKLEIRLAKETKLYWFRAATGVISALIGTLVFGLLSWGLLIWMLIFWFGTPFLVSFLIFRYKYDEEEWNWKNIIKPGIGIYFFLFMIVAIFFHTLRVTG